MLWEKESFLSDSILLKTFTAISAALSNLFKMLYKLLIFFKTWSYCYKKTFLTIYQLLYFPWHLEDNQRLFCPNLLTNPIGASKQIMWPAISFPQSQLANRFTYVPNSKPESNYIWFMWPGGIW